jgi:CelD/BcsL family acetyltransferase involved in cellulose biosynthesis
MNTDNTHYNILTSIAEVEAIEADWRALQASIGNDVFTDYDWFHIWWRTIGNVNGRMLHIITARKEDKLVGLLPLAVIIRKGFRVLQATGAEAFYMCDILAEDEKLAEQLWRYARKSPHYDFAHLRDVYPHSLGKTVLSRFAKCSDINKAYSLRLKWKNSDEWIASLSKKSRSNRRNTIKLLERIGPVEHHICQTLPLAEGIIEGMVHYKNQWCNEHGMQGMFDQPNILDYHRQLAQTHAKHGTLALSWLTCGNDILSYHVMYIYKKTVHSYVLATNPAWSEHSPGHLENQFAISWAIDNGYSVFDLMHGDFAYKKRLTDTVDECKEFFFNQSLRGWAGQSLFIYKRALKNRLKKLLKR